MVRRYKRKTNDNYSKETLRESVKAVREEKMTPTQAARVFGVPRSTIIAHVKGDRGVKSQTRGRPTLFNPDLEKNIATLLHVMERNGFGLTQREVRALVGQYVRRNNIDTPFKDGIPGEEWTRGFKQRNKLSMKKPQGVEIARKKAADPFLVNEFYDLLEDIVEKQKLSGAQIWNMDETSFCQDPGKSKIVGLVGFQATRTISSPGRDNTTVLFASNSLGQKLPPLIIFKGTYLWNTWLPDDDSNNTAAFAATSKGWMEASVLESYFSNVVIPEICKTGKPQLVVFDGHSTHLDLNVIQKASENQITLLKLPAHTSHILQPLDVSTMKSLKDRWDQRLIKWQRLNIGKKLPKKEFTQILVEIWDELDPAILRNGFRKTGIYPFDRNQIGEDKLDPSALLRWKKHLADKMNEAQENDTVQIAMQEREPIAEEQQNQKESKNGKTSQEIQQPRQHESETKIKRPQKQEPEKEITPQKAKQTQEQDSQTEEIAQKTEQPEEQDFQTQEKSQKPQQPEEQDSEAEETSQETEQPEEQDLQTEEKSRKPQQPEKQDLQAEETSQKTQQPEKQDLQAEETSQKTQQPEEQDLQKEEISRIPQQPEEQDSQAEEFKTEQPEEQVLQTEGKSRKAQQPEEQDLQTDEKSRKPQQPEEQDSQAEETSRKNEQPEEQALQTEEKSRKPQQPEEQDLQAEETSQKPKGDIVKKSNPYKLMPRNGSNKGDSLKILSNEVVYVSGNKENLINVTFESLLLETISKGKEEPKIQRKRVGMGAEVITNKDYLEKRKKEIEESSKKTPKTINPKKNNPRKQKKVIKPKNKQQMPKKRKRAISDSETTIESEIMSIHSDSDLSDIDSGSETGVIKKLEEPKIQRNRLSMGAEVITNKDYLEKRKKEIGESSKKNPKPINPMKNNPPKQKKVIKPKNKLQLPKKRKSAISDSETTIESKIMSIQSESDLSDIYSGSKNIDSGSKDVSDTESASKTGVIKTETERVEVQKYNDDLENYTVDRNDTVLVRYYEKKKWKYYVGVIQNVEKNNRYRVIYYKHTKDSEKKLIFSMPKIEDTDVVPMIHIVKQIELFQISENPSRFVLANDEDETYF